MTMIKATVIAAMSRASSPPKPSDTRTASRGRSRRLRAGCDAAISSRMSPPGQPVDASNRDGGPLRAHHAAVVSPASSLTALPETDRRRARVTRSRRAGVSRHLLEVEDDVGAGAGAAEERLPGAGQLQRGRGVADVAGEDRRDAGVADAGAARPSGGDVAGVGELEQRAVLAGPPGREAAAGEGDLRSDAGRSGWLVRRRVPGVRQTGVDRGAGAEQLGADAGAVETEV